MALNPVPSFSDAMQDAALRKIETLTVGEMKYTRYTRSIVNFSRTLLRSPSRANAIYAKATVTSSLITRSSGRPIVPGSIDYPVEINYQPILVADNGSTERGRFLLLHGR